MSLSRSSRTLLLGLIGAFAVTVGACASSGATQSRRASANVMDSTEFRRPEFRTIYDAIKALHPDWLLARGGPTSITNPAMQTPVIGVFIEGQSHGYPVDKLTEFVPGDVKAVRRILPSESLGTYGSDWPWGGIVITRAR